MSAAASPPSARTPSATVPGRRARAGGRLRAARGEAGPGAGPKPGARAGCVVAALVQAWVRVPGSGAGGAPARAAGRRRAGSV